MTNVKLLLFIPLFLLIGGIPVFAQSEDLKDVSNQFTNNTGVTNFESSPVLIDVVEKVLPGSLTGWVAIISGIATIMLVIVVWNQMIVTKKDISSRLRPWIAPVGVKAALLKFPDGRIIEYEDISRNAYPYDKKPETVIMKITIKNVGSIPASKIDYRLLKSEKEITREEIEKVKISKQEGFILPNETSSINYEVPLQKFEKEQYYLAILIVYKVNDKSISKVGKIWKIKGNSRELVIDWI